MAQTRLADAVVDTVPVGDQSALLLVTPAERALVDAAPSPRRAGELLAGRAAAHLALAAAAPGLPPTSVLADPQGRPRLDPPAAVHLSLAHDGPLAAAAAAPLPVGLDLVDLARAAQVERVVAGRLASGRAVGLEGAERLPWSAAVLLWSAWEALGKRTGEGVLSGPMQERLLLGRHEGLLAARGAGALVRWWQEGEVLVCLATTEPGR